MPVYFYYLNMPVIMGFFYLIDHDLVFENASTNKIEMNHIKSMLCGNLMGIDKLERLKLLQSDPLFSKFRSKSRKRYPDSWETSATRPPRC
jgi:hypothetical protein